MSQKDKHVYPYIPNSVPETKAKMMEEIGIKDIEELYEDIPEHLRFKGKLNLPEELSSEYALKRHVESILSKNQSCKDHLNFLGGGCWLQNADLADGLHGRSPGPDAPGTSILHWSQKTQKC